MTANRQGYATNKESSSSKAVQVVILLSHFVHFPARASRTNPWQLATVTVALAAFLLCSVGCSDGESGGPPPSPWACVVTPGDDPDFTQQVGCSDDFLVLGTRPLDASIPGARSAKTVVDRAAENALYFTNSNRYPMHYEFARDHLSGSGLPPVGDISMFNQVEYYSPSRRFLLGAITLYEEPGVWTYELAPYDTSSAEMIYDAYQLIRNNSFFGEQLFFHPTSATIEMVAAELPPDVKVITNDELFAGITFQPLNLGESYGQLRFFQADQLDQQYVSPRDVVVLDRVPNDITVVAGIITAELQTPLSHINVLSQNRGTPNMALRGAYDDGQLRQLEDSWVRFKVDAFSYTVEAATKEQADAWWEEHKPPAVQVPQLDLSATDLRDIELLTLDDIPAYGGKACHYGVMTQIGDEVPHPKAFAIPVFYYDQFMKQNGFDTQMAALLTDTQFINDPAHRDEKLKEFRHAMWEAPVDTEFKRSLLGKLNKDYPSVRMRFRSSTNAEDLDGFTGAGLYSSKSGDPNDPTRPILTAVRKVWASIWNFRAFEERTHRSIDHPAVAMAILVHHSFPDEEVNGVALTGNMFDETQPAFYINVQAGEASVVKPDAGVTVDSFLYYYYYPGQPMTFFSHSNLIPAGQTVITPTQAYYLGAALDAVHRHFSSYYSQPGHFYAMDVEFKFDDLGLGGEPQLWVKQARPHAGWGGSE